MIRLRRYRPVIFFVSIFAVLAILNLLKGGPINWIQNFFIAILVALIYKVVDSFSNNDKEKNTLLNCAFVKLRSFFQLLQIGHLS